MYTIKRRKRGVGSLIGARARSGETFKLHVFVGSVAAEKIIVQAPWG